MLSKTQLTWPERAKERLCRSDIQNVKDSKYEHNSPDTYEQQGWIKEKKDGRGDKERQRKKPFIVRYNKSKWAAEKGISSHLLKLNDQSVGLHKLSCALHTRSFVNRCSH